MPDTQFRALVLRRPATSVEAQVETIDEKDLPPGDVLVRVRYSSLNYKDGMAITGTGNIVRNFPFVPGIDFAGTVERSASERFKASDEVILTGWGVGDRRWGGLAEKVQVEAGWLLPLPEGLSMRDAMAHGTAGLSAMLCVDALERYGIDKSREVLVTGAGGGVGGIAILALSRLGYRVVASTGRPDQEAYFKGLGAESVIDRATISAAPDKPLLAERWGGVVDNVGGTTLSNVLAATAYGGAVAALGLAGGRDVPTTVLPFILRGVALLGVDSVSCPVDRRVAAWQRLAQLFPQGLPSDLVEEIPLEEVPEHAAALIAGQVRGRTVVSLAD